MLFGIHGPGPYIQRAPPLPVNTFTKSAGIAAPGPPAGGSGAGVSPPFISSGKATPRHTASIATPRNIVVTKKMGNLIFMGEPLDFVASPINCPFEVSDVKALRAFLARVLTLPCVTLSESSLSRSVAKANFYVTGSNTWRGIICPFWRSEMSKPEASA